MSFIDDGAVPIGKVRRYPVPVGADPTQYFTADEWNEICQALLDLRARLRDALSLNTYNSGVADFSNVDNVVITFDTSTTGDGAFVTGQELYKVFLTSETDSGPPPDVWVASKTLTGFTLQANAAWTGKVHWEAKF